MPLQIIHRDITTMQCDAIVNPTDRCFSGRGGTDLAIHTAAGKALVDACAELSALDFGEVAVTRGFGLPCKYIIHTMGPVWTGGEQNETVLLRSCYVNALIKAKRLGAKSIAFPLISSGTFGFPKDRVLRIAIDAISDFLFTVDSELDVFVCVLNRGAFELSKDVALREYLSGSKRFAYEDHAIKMRRVRGVSSDSLMRGEVESEAMPYRQPIPVHASGAQSLGEWIKKHDDSFALTLLKLIDKKGMDDVECYKKANVTKNTFWKIKNDGKYRPSKPTVIAFAIALELTLEETDALLKSAGFALSHNNDFDMIIEFYISQGCYDIFEINAALYKYDQPCLGC